MQKKEMADAKAIKWATVQAVAEEVKAAVLTINEEAEG